MLTSLRAAQLSQAVYKPPYTFQVGDVCANLVYEDGLKILVFQGTEDVLEIIRDVRAIPTSFPKLGPIHSGVLEGALAIFPLVVALAPDVIVGHSLGGGLAVVESGLLCAYGKAPLQLCALEPLMVTTDDILGQLIAQIPNRELICNGNDPVPHLPIILPNFPWRHTQPLTMIGHNYFPNVDAHKIENVIKELALVGG